jgi:hypothetical protein
MNASFVNYISRSQNVFLSGSQIPVLQIAEDTKDIALTYLILSFALVCNRDELRVKLVLPIIEIIRKQPAYL